MTDRVNKYLTDMKELPPESSKEGELKDIDVIKTPASEILKKQVVEEEEYVNEQSNTLLEDQFEGEDFDDSEVEDWNSKPFTRKDILLGVINLFCIIAIIFLVIKFPQKSLELKTEKNQMILNDSGFSYELSEVNAHKVKADEIAGLFVNDSGLADFLNELEILQTDTGLIKKVSFTNQKVVEDKTTGLSGIPVIIEFSGQLSEILLDLEKIHRLPFILRSVTVDSSQSTETPGVVNLRYGAFLYVGESLK